MRRWLREPLVHFLLGGAALFVLYGEVGDGRAPPPDRIVVDEARVESLAAAFQRTWMRPPTATELEGLVDDYVTEEILYREALALGLDRNDLVVRRRMRQKMEFLNDGLAEREPTEEELAAFLAEHPERFREPARMTFTQVFVGSAEAGATERAAALRSRLRKGEDPATLGEPTLLPSRLSDAGPSQVAQVFGEDFAGALADVPEGAWSDPVPSAFGLHLVRMTARTPERQPALDEVRAEVEREWEAQQRSEARERFLRTLRARYEVELPPGVELPPRETPPSNGVASR